MFTTIYYVFIVYISLEDFVKILKIPKQISKQYKKILFLTIGAVVQFDESEKYELRQLSNISKTSEESMK